MFSLGVCMSFAKQYNYKIRVVLWEDKYSIMDQQWSQLAYLILCTNSSVTVIMLLSAYHWTINKKNLQLKIPSRVIIFSHVYEKGKGSYLCDRISTKKKKRREFWFKNLVKTKIEIWYFLAWTQFPSRLAHTMKRLWSQKCSVSVPSNMVTTSHSN